jgi:hypothetical protein
LPRIQLTRIEELDLAHPELKLVDTLRCAIRVGATLEDAQDLILEKTGELLSIQNISHWKQKAIVLPAKRIQAAVEGAEADLKLLKLHSVSDVTQAQLLKQQIESVRCGEKIGLAFALSEQRQWAAMKIKQQELKQREQDVTRKEKLIATGDLDGRDLYLRAAQDVLKKLQTYKELKPALETRREEIVGELAHAAEAFVKKLEAQA